MKKLYALSWYGILNPSGRRHCRGGAFEALICQVVVRTIFFNMHINDMPFAKLLPELVQESQGSGLFHKY